MPKVRSFRDLEVWQSGMDLVVSLYKATDRMPSAERFGLTAQARRAVVSIPSNVAEGHARRSDAAFLNHVKIALGSEAELSTQVEAARRLGLLEEAVAVALLAESDRTRQMLHGLRRTLERSRQVSAGLTSAGVLVVLVFVLI
jgi:four helix bundle protein